MVDSEHLLSNVASGEDGHATQRSLPYADASK